MFIPVALAESASANAPDDVSSGLAKQIAEFFRYLIGQIPSWIAGFIFLVVTIIVAKMAKAAVESRISSQIDEEHQEVLILAGRVTYFGTLAVGIIVALKIAGIDLTAILAAVAFGIGFALRDLIMNFLSGVMILIGRQFTIGDFIKVGGTVGKVVEIQTRATIIKAVDGTKVIIPNADIFTKQVVSWTGNPMRRIVVPVYVSYDTDISYAIKVAMGVMKKHPKIFKKPSPSVIVQDFGDSTIDLAARCWVSSHGWFKVRSDIMHKMWNALTEAGIVVPYNIMHLETHQDTAEVEKDFSEIARKKMEEMKAASALRKAAKTAAVNGNGEGKIAPMPAQAPVAAPTAPAVATLATAPAAIPTEPPGAYQDQTEIDGQG